VRVQGPAGQPSLLFQRVPEPRITKNRIHLDLRCAGFDAEIERLTALGARSSRYSHALNRSPDSAAVVRLLPKTDARSRSRTAGH
jgi:hypothetical protein